MSLVEEESLADGVVWENIWDVPSQERSDVLASSVPAVTCRPRLVQPGNRKSIYRS